MKTKLHRSEIFKRVLSMAMAIVMLVGLMPVSAFAATNSTLYLIPGVWDVDDAWFAAWAWGGSSADAWYTFTDADGDGIYETQIPSDRTGIKFVRMNPEYTEPSWDGVWNDSGDQTIDGNCYTVNGWDVAGTWSTYTPDVVVYLDPGSNWPSDNAWFAAYFFEGDNNTWAAMTDEDGDGNYEVVVPDGYSNVIFCRMNPEYSEPSWDAKWNQSVDLTVPTDDNNLFVIENPWNESYDWKATGFWTAVSSGEEEEETQATEPAPDGTYYVAGVAALCGDEWSANSAANKMTWNGSAFEKVYTSVAAGTYQFKITDGTWDNAWGDNGQNYTFEVSSACDVTITFDPDTKAITVSGDDVGAVSGLEISSITAVGSGSGSFLNGKSWDVAASVNHMTASGDVYTITYESVAAGTYEVKFAANNSWNDNWGSNGSAYSGGAAEAVYNGQNIKFTVDAVSDVTLKLDLSNFDYSTKNGATYTITMVEGSGEEEPAEVDYYLVGYINGADYGIEGDSANLGDYKFVNGKLTVTFTEQSYVVVKNGSNEMYMAEVYSTDTSVTLKKGAGEKLGVPGNMELTFTLVENADGTLTLSYAQVVDVPEIPEGYNTVTIHFLKPSTWGSTVNAWIWNANGALPGYEAYNTAWPGSPIPAAEKAGWYDITVGTAEPQDFNFIFNDGSNQTADLTTGEVTGPTELWVVDGTVYTIAPLEWTHYTATIHFQKPEGWGDTVNAYAWTENGNLLGDWPGTVTSPAPTAGWYTSTIYVEIGQTLNFIFNDGSNQTGDLTAGKMTGNIELWIDGNGNEVSAPDGWVDANRTIHLPGTLGNNNWNAAGNQMEYDATRGLYTITFEDVTPGTYYYKIAVNGSWGENYGANGEASGADMSVTVTEKQDVTFWYNDSTHRVVCSVDYDIDADITLSGTGVADTKLTDPELDGQYTATVKLSAGTYSDLTITHGDYTVEFSEFTLSADKNVTFYYDPATGLAYHNGSDVKVETDDIYYTTKDLEYKDPFGAVAVGEEVTFSITTGTDATGVALAIRGLGAVKLEKDGEAVDGVQRWTCTTTFLAIGEYQYYFAITNGSDMVFYCDDNYIDYYKKGDYGTGGIGNPDDIFAYDLVVYEAGYETPDWMKNAVIYQIFPDRFFDGDETNNQAQTWARGTVDYEYITDWYTLPENPEMANDPNYPENAHKGDGEWSNEIYGGDLEGIIERIDYLKALGVNVIYLNPVFWSISNHRYDAVSYTEIDPILGTLGDFEELVAVAEANDMHIILDGVFNHVSDDSVYFDRYYKFLPDAAEKYDGKIGAYPYWAYVYDYMSENSASQSDAEAAAKAYFSENYGITDYSYTEWFAVSSTTTASVDNIGLRAGKNVYSYEGWWGYDSMPVIYSTNGSEYQTGNWAEEIIDGQNSVNAYWISKGMDGWRLDVANEVSDETWQNFRDSVKALDSEAVIIGEIWADATHYLMGDMYDSVMNYVFRDAVAGFARGYLINRDNKTEKYDSDLTADDAMTILEILRERYPEEAFYAMMNLVASHDTSRILSYLDDVEDDRYQKDIEHAFPTYEGTSDRAKQLQYVVSFLQFTYAGAPTIYYGDEIGMVGGDDPDDRRAFTWGMGNQELVEWYAQLAAVRAAYPALRTGSVEPFSTGNENVMGFVRADDANKLVILANRAASAQNYELEGTYVDLITGEPYTGTVPAYRGVILVAEDEVKEITVDTEGLAPAYDEAYIVEERCDGENHDYESVVTDPTCTEQGYTTYTCSCGDSYVADYVDALGHDYEAVVTDPTCTEQGYTTYTCHCGDSYTEEIPATGHNVILVESVAATCELNGYEYYACEHCGGQEYQIILEATGHSYVDGTCEHCGAEDLDADKPGTGGIFDWIQDWIGGWFDPEPEDPTEPPVTEPEEPEEDEKPGWDGWFDWFWPFW